MFHCSSPLTFLLNVVIVLIDVSFEIKTNEIKF